MTQKLLTFICVLAICVTNAQAQEFDIHKYLEQMMEMPTDRFNIGDVELKEYALIDIDGDGLNEVWVRGDLNYQALYTVEGDKVNKIAYADGSTDLTFYKKAVGYSAYYSPGRSEDGAQMLKNSRLTDSYHSVVTFDIFSDEQEITSEYYFLNGKKSTEKACNKFKKKLGKPVATPQPVWHPIQ